jgi:hypothetical protein
MTITVLSYDGVNQSSVWVNNPVNGKVFTNFVTGIYITFRPTTGVTYDNYIYPMLTYADITDSTYEPYQATVNTRISALETLSDAVYKYHQSAFAKYDTGYVLRVGNQVHINLTATFHTSCEAWVGSIVKLPFKVKTPDSSTRYTLKQTQTDGRETSIYLQNGGTTFFTSTAFQKGDIITISPLILDMYVEETATTEGGE